jgi:hypothetical protein
MANKDVAGRDRKSSRWDTVNLAWNFSLAELVLSVAEQLHDLDAGADCKPMTEIASSR